MNKIEKFIKEYDFNKNIIFDWNVWVWKTFTMKKLYSMLPKNDWSVNKYWIDDWQMREFITSWNFSLRDTHDYHCSIVNYPLEMCLRAKVLFFDDLWSSWNVSEAQKTKLKFLLDEREKKWFVNIFSTNISPKQTQELYWERIKSRIYNSKSKKWLLLINITGQDKRKENIETMTL